MKELLPQIYYIIAVLGIVVFGAIAHSFAAFQKYRKTGEIFTSSDFVILSFLAAFSGTMTGLATYAIISQHIIIVSMLAGLGAFAGMALLDRITVIMIDIFENMLKSLIRK